MRHRKQSTSTSNSSNGIGDTDDKATSDKLHARGRSKRVLPNGVRVFLATVVSGAVVFFVHRLAGNSNRNTSDAAAYLSHSTLRSGVQQPKESIKPNSEGYTKIQDQYLTSPTTGATLHVVFSTGCSPSQRWQSYLFFHSALKVNQPGIITRIASGCNEEQFNEEKDWHETHVQNGMSDRFQIHFTPDFSGEKNYYFFNKPFGLRHFMEHSELMGISDDGSINNPDSIVILCDPDFLLLRPLTDDFSDERTLITPVRKWLLDRRSNRRVVTHGIPYAQTWTGLGNGWMKYNIDKIAGEGSPAKEVDEYNNSVFYQVGPPYFATGQDMFKIVVKWSDFAPVVHKEKPLHHAEMHAYCMAAAHLGLQHILIDSLAISSAGLSGEGWKFIDDIPSDEICSFAGSRDHSKYPLPSVIHYCYWQYAVEKSFFSKFRVPHDIFTCDHPLLVEPPEDVGSGRYLSLVTGGKKSERQRISAEREKRNGFILCAMTLAINDAMVYFKEQHCDAGGNRAKTFDLWAAD